MDLRQLEYFVQIATHGGFNRASAVLHVAQSALSRHMRQLEYELGVALFERSARGVQLTPAGEFMVERATTLLQQFRQTKDDLMTLAQVPRGDVSIGIPMIMRDTLANPLIQRFNDRYPDVRITLVAALSDELREMAMAHKLDLAVYGVLEPEDTLRSMSLMREDVMAVGPPNAPLAGYDSIALDQLTGLPLVVSSRQRMKALVRRSVRLADMNLDHVQEIGDGPMQIEMVLSGKFYSILARSMVQPLIDRGQLAAAALRGLQYYWIVAHAPDHAMSAAGRALQAMLVEIAEETVAANPVFKSCQDFTAIQD